MNGISSGNEHAAAASHRRYVKPAPGDDAAGRAPPQWVDVEPSLDAAEAARLEADREAFVQALKTGAGCTPHDVVRLVTDNVLAQHSGSGHALAFLSRHRTHERNAHLLGHFLQTLVRHHQARCVPAELQPAWTGCLELAAHALVASGWFDDAPKTKLAEVANRLAKFPANAACRRGIDWIAARLSGEDVRALPARHFALLANAFAKHPGSAACTGAMRAFALRLSCDEAFVASLDRLPAATVLSALSRWPEDDACAQAGARIVHRLDEDKALFEATAADPTTLSTVLTAASKWARDAVSTRVASSLAQRLAVDPALLDAVMVDRGDAMLNAISKWPREEPCRRAAVALATRLATQARAQRMGWGRRAVAIHGLSTWPQEPSCLRAVQSLALPFLRLPQPPTGMEPHDVARMLSGLGHWPHDDVCAGAAQTLAAWLAEQADMVDAMTHADAMRALDGVAQWPREPACRLAAQRLAARLRQDDARPLSPPPAGLRSERHA